MKKKEVLTLLQKNDVHLDKIIGKKDGTFEARFGFFYTHGRTSGQYAEKIGKVPNVKVIEDHEIWNNWPKDSYFQVIFEVNA